MKNIKEKEENLELENDKKKKKKSKQEPEIDCKIHLYEKDVEGLEYFAEQELIVPKSKAKGNSFEIKLSKSLSTWMFRNRDILWNE